MTALSDVLGRGLASARPADPSAGTVYFSTDVSALERYSGTTWETFAASGLTLEAVMDALGTAQLVAGTGIGLAYDDAALSGVGTITIASTVTQYTDEMARDALGTALTAGAGISVTPNDGSDTIAIASTITQYTDEMARDALAAALVAGSNVTITPNDGADTITIAASAGAGYTDEQVRDVIGAALVAGSGVTITVNDGADTITIAASGGGGSVSPYGPLISGRLYNFNSFYGGGVATNNTTAARLYGMPFLVPEAVTVDRLHCTVMAATASNVRMGIYQAGSDGLPGGLVIDGGEVASAGIAERLLTISQALTAGRYWLACQTDVALAMATHTSTGAVSVLGYPSNSISGPGHIGVYRTVAYGALPNPFGTITAYLATATPIVSVRAA